MSNIGKYVNYDTTIVSTLNSKIVRLKIIQNRKSLIPCSKIELPVDRDTIKLSTVHKSVDYNEGKLNRRFVVRMTSVTV